MNEQTPLRHAAVDLDRLETTIREPAKTFADLTDDTAHGITKLTVAMADADEALQLIAQAAAATLEKEKLARRLIEAVRASVQK